MIIIMLGAPGTGKGTVGNLLANKLNIPHISSGEIFRSYINDEDEIGKQVKEYVSEGKLVPDELTIKLLEKRLQEPDTKNGCILDGYPRSLEQAEKLELINAKVDGNEEVSFKAIYFDIDTEILIDRIVNRQSCPVCGEIYNKKFKPSKVENKCDKCNVALKTRDDDTEEVARKRFDTYFEQTAPLIEFYEKKGVLYKLDANGSIEDVWERLLKIVEA